MGPAIVPCREVVLFSEVEMYCIYAFGDIGSVPFSEGPLLGSIQVAHIQTHIPYSEMHPEQIFAKLIFARCGCF